MSEGLDRISSYEDVFENWKFFVEGLGKINDISAPRGEIITLETLLRVIMDCVVSRPRESVVYIVRSKNAKPLAYIVAFDNSSRYCEEKSCLVYALYSNGKSKTASRVAYAGVEQWARKLGFTEMQAFSPRRSGAFFRWARRWFGFEPKMTFFSKKL